MSFAEAIAALRNLFNMSADLPLAAAVDEMCSSKHVDRGHGFAGQRGRSLCGMWFLRGQGVCGPDFLSEIGENLV